MPHTLLERMVATVMLLCGALLIFLAVRETMESDEPRATATVAEVLTPTPPTTTDAAPVKPVARPRTATKAAPPAQPLTRLVLVAAGGESWLDVRAGSQQGKVLFAGTLAQGGKVDVKAKQLWVRFGAASHLEAQLNGKPLALRAGTYNALIGLEGLQLVAG